MQGVGAALLPRICMMLNLFFLLYSVYPVISVRFCDFFDCHV